MATVLKLPCDEESIRGKRADGRCREGSGPWVLAATILGSSMVFIDTTVVNVALPVLQRELQASVDGVQWVVEAYSLMLAALILVGGSLGDHFGRRRVFAIGTVVFALASIACGLAPSLLALVVARAVQGLGGALLTPGSLAIISASFEGDERGKAIGTWSGFTALTSAAGPVLGGWLVQAGSWRDVFFVNAPLAVLVLALAFRHSGEPGRACPARRARRPAGHARAGRGGVRLRDSLDGRLLAAARVGHTGSRHGPAGPVRGGRGAQPHGDDAPGPVPVALLQRRQPVHPAAVRGPGWRAVLRAVQPAAGAGLPAAGGGGGAAAVRAADVPAVALVGRADRPLRSPDAAGDRAADRRLRVPAVRARGGGRELLDDVLPGSGAAGPGHGAGGGAAVHHGHDVGGQPARRAGLGREQRGVADRRRAGRGGAQPGAGGRLRRRTRAADGLAVRRGPRWRAGAAEQAGEHRRVRRGRG